MRSVRKIQLRKAKQMMLRYGWGIEKINPKPPTSVNEMLVKVDEKEWVLKGQFEELLGWYYYPTYDDKKMIIWNNEQKRGAIAVKGAEMIKKFKSKLVGLEEKLFEDYDKETPTASISSSKTKEIDVIIDALQTVVA